MPVLTTHLAQKFFFANANLVNLKPRLTESRQILQKEFSVQRISAISLSPVFVWTLHTAILGPIAGYAQECMNNGWEKTVRNLAICVAVGEVSYFKLKLLCFKSYHSIKLLTKNTPNALHQNSS